MDSIPLGVKPIAPVHYGPRHVPWCGSDAFATTLDWSAVTCAACLTKKQSINTRNQAECEKGPNGEHFYEQVFGGDPNVVTLECWYCGKRK